MKQWLVIGLGALLGFGMVIESAEAKRLGGGRSVGSQRQIAPQQPAKSAQQAAPASTPAAAPRSGLGRWLAPLAGLALALGLVSLFGEDMGSLVLAVLLAGIAFFVIRALFRALSPQPAAQTPQGAQFRNLGRETEAAPPPSQSLGGMQPEAPAQFSPAIPEGFDVDAFVAQAKRNFLALQAANDRGDLDALREMMSDELYENIAGEIHGRGDTAQQTDVVTLDAQLLEVVTDQDMHWASIRFSGMLREDVSDTATRFEEIWNLQKPANGRTGWMLAGIQQVA